MLASCHNQFGKMWECPDFFCLDGRHVLLASPQDMTSMGLEFHPGNSTLCIIGQYDREKKHLLLFLIGWVLMVFPVILVLFDMV